MSLAQHNYNTYLVTQLMLLARIFLRSQGRCGKADQHSRVAAMCDGISHL
jgi:hypothetical protein